MPDYGDDRGFRSRGVPADIGFDRAGPVRGTNYNEGYRPGDVTVSNVPFNPRSTFNRDTPVQMGGSRGEFAPPLYSGRNPFIQPIQTGGRLGEFGGMDSGQYLASRFGGGVDDAAGMNDSARGMIEDAGFEVAGKTTDDRMVEKLWGKAVNNFPPGTPDMVLQQEWERLKQDYFGRKYGGQGPTLPGRGDIVGLS